MEAPLFAFSWTTVALALVILGAALWRCQHWLRRRRDGGAAERPTRDVLARDARHRVTSTLQMILSLVRIHERRVRSHAEEPEEAAAALRAAEERISTVAIVFRELHRIAEAGTAEMQALLWMVTDSLAASAAQDVAVTIQGERLSLSERQAIPVALIVGEWTAHRLARLPPLSELRIHLRAEAGLLLLSYADDGPDWDSNLDDDMLHAEVVTALVQQLSGTLIRAPGAGVRLLLTVPGTAARARREL